MKPTTAHQEAQWDLLARNWARLGPPLRPSLQDREHFTELLNFPACGPVTGIILGVTPELYRLPWPTLSKVHAIDCSPGMIQRIWPGPLESAHLSNWLHMPLPTATADYVVCDGGLHLLNFSTGQPALAKEVCRVLKPNGKFVLRLFSLPEKPENPAAVWNDFQAARIANVHILKLRLGMALQTSPEAGVRLGDVFESICRECSDLEGVSRISGWPQNEVQTLLAYQDCENRYHFTTTDQGLKLIQSGGLVLERRLESCYPLGDRCPMISFRKKGAD